jgi:hypothetical protein
MPPSSSSSSVRSSSVSKFSLVFGPPSSDAYEWSKTDLLDILYWFRQLLGFLFGVCYGLYPLVGLPGLISYVTLSSALVLLYSSSILKADEEEIGKFELLTEGFMPAFAIFNLAWIAVYSLPGNI